VSDEVTGSVPAVARADVRSSPPRLDVIVPGHVAAVVMRQGAQSAPEPRFDEPAAGTILPRKVLVVELVAGIETQ